MLKWWIRRRLEAFGKTYHYDMGYARAILDADLDAMNRFGKFLGLVSYRKGVPPAPWHASKIVGALAGDCGPCIQLGVTMAEREGIDPAVLRAILEGDELAMPDDVALAYRFAQAVLARDPEADGLREQVVDRWGMKGLISLAFGIAASGFFPTIKSAVGHARSCSTVTVGGKITAVRRAQEV